MKPFGGVFRFLSAVVLAAGLAACGAPSSVPLMSSWESETGFGYTERRLGGERYEIRYVTPFVRTSLDPKKRAEEVERLGELAYEIALWRTANLAIARQFEAFAIASSQGDVEVQDYDDTPNGVRYGLAHPNSGYRFVLSPGPRIRSAWLKATSELTVILKPRAGPDDMDARTTAARLAGKHKGAYSLRTF